MSKSICTECSHKLRCDAADLRGGDTAITRCYGFTNGGFTNADRIRAMSDEELAEFLAEYRCVHKAPHCMEANCAQCWLEWLRKETKE